MPLQLDSPASWNAYSSKFTLFVFIDSSLILAESIPMNASRVSIPTHTYTFTRTQHAARSTHTYIHYYYSSFCRHLVATEMAHIVFGRINMNRLIKCVVCAGMNICILSSSSASSFVHGMLNGIFFSFSLLRSHT